MVDVATPPKTTTVRLTYIGRRMTTANKPVYVWQEDDGTHRIYDKQLVSSAVGGIWDIRQAPDGRVFRSGKDVEPQYLGLHTNPEERVAWELEHDVTETLARQYRQAKTDMSHSELVQLLGRSSATTGGSTPPASGPCWPPSSRSSPAEGASCDRQRAAGHPQVVVDAEGVTWRPWTDGYAVGFQATHQDGRVEYVYLNPSSDSDDGQPNVFLYAGPEGDSGQDAALSHVNVFEPAADPDQRVELDAGVPLDLRTWRPVHES